MRKSGARGVALGLSGGVDSAVAGALCVKALGKGSVTAVTMPSRTTPKDDVNDARSLIRMWGVDSLNVPISPLVEELQRAAGFRAVRVAMANVQARARMTVLYFVANANDLLVVGTGDRSEITLGYFTKFGDGGADLLPIAHLYKTQVRLLARALGIPPRVANKPSSPRLWQGHLAEQELPAGYEKLDLVMSALSDLGLSKGEAAEVAGVPAKVVSKVLEMNKRSAHKRAMPRSLAGPDDFSFHSYQRF